MKLFTIYITVIIFASYDLMRVESACADKIDLAQACAEGCVETATTDSYSNLLTSCLANTTSNFAVELDACCGCETNMQEAETCLKSDLENLATKSENYLMCIWNSKGLCFADLCVGLFTGGYGDGLWNDFAVGTDSSFASISRNADTCDDMTGIGFGVCDTIAPCCRPCEIELAGVVNAVIDDLLLGTYSNLTNCGGDKTCDDYMLTSSPSLSPTTIPASRRLEVEDELFTGLAGTTSQTTIDAEDAAFVADLAKECNDGLINEMLAFNETYAIRNHFDCLYKKTGKIMAQTEPEESSSASHSVVGASISLSSVASIVLSLFM